MSAGDTAQTGWIASASALSLLFREFPDGTVCFDPATTETRLLAPLTSFLLECLAGDSPQAVTAADLVERVLAVDESGADPQAAANAVDSALAELAQAGLALPGEAACGA